MSSQEANAGTNRPRLSLHVPEPQFRPGDTVDFSHLEISEAGAQPRPDEACPASETWPLCTDMIRVLGEDNQAHGPWDPRLSPDKLRELLRQMALVRAFDNRMYRAQRQGKTSFYLKCTGEEATSVCATQALDFEDMIFPSYRQQGCLIARGYPILEMVNQIYSNRADKLKGRQLPILYSAASVNFFTISGNLGTQLPQATGFAMASAMRGDSRIAAGWVGEGATAEGDFHAALTFAAVYNAPVIFNVTNNQWAISSFSGIAGAERPRLVLPGAAVDRRVVGSRMALGAVGEELDQRRSGVGARAIRRPALGRIYRQRIVAVDPQAGDTVTDRAGGEGGPLSPGEPREARYRPLIIGHVENDRRIVNRRERERRVEITLGRGALANPACCNPAVALHRAGHSEPGCLGKLGAQIARDGEEVHRGGRIEDRQLAALQLVGAVRVDLVDHLDDRIAARDHAPLLAVRGENHVLEVERLRGDDRGRLLARAFEIEAGLALPLRAVHPGVESSGQRHEAEQLAQLIGRKARIPRAVRHVIFTEDADEIAAQRIGCRCGASLVRPWLSTWLGQMEM